MEAGPELSVAATKTFIASASALLHLAAAWSGERALAEALARLPERLERACGLDWSAALPALEHAQSLVTIGRGPTLAIAREAALKLKETCNVHAEAFSGAEFMHGPVTLVGNDFPILMFTPTDAGADGMRRLAGSLREKGASLFAADPEAGGLPSLPPDHADADAICLVQSFYGLAVRLAALRGIDVDQPRHLQKVTRTR
jgi:glucosamine--fructose-6-phosphate aminotransferase (isomerizing)